MRCIDSIKEAIGMSLQLLRGLLWTGHCEHHSFIGLVGGGADSTACNIHGVKKEEKNQEWLLFFCFVSAVLKLSNWMGAIH